MCIELKQLHKNACISVSYLINLEVEWTDGVLIIKVHMIPYDNKDDIFLHDEEL